MQKCEGCLELETKFKILESDILSINATVSPLAHSHSAMREAFTLNDLGRPDYDGHRMDHKRRITDTVIVEDYKQSAVKEAIKWILIGAMALSASGLANWISSHIK